MLFHEKLILVLFLTAVFAVYAGAAAMLAAALWRRRRGATQPLSRGYLWLRRGVLALAVLGLACIGYGFIEPYRLEVSRVTVTTPRLPAGARPFRLALISDLHSDPRARLEERLPEVIAREKPDAILFGGDAVNSPGGLPVFRRCMEELARIAPTFAVRGNWDVFYWKDMDLFAGTGVRELDSEAVSITRDDATLWIAGAPLWGDWRIEEALQRVPRNAPTVLLYHLPAGIDPGARAGVDLVCAGHNHGGQIALPGYGALLLLSRHGKRFESGLYRVQNTWLYVNRGIGMEGRVPRVRFCARPEVTVIDLAPE